MGFSEKTKRELARVIPEKRCCRIAELSAFYDFNGYLLGNGRYLDINHFTPIIARKILTLIKGSFPTVKTQVLVQRSRARKNQVCTVRVLTPEDAQKVYQVLQGKVPAQSCCQSAYIRGAFLSHGSITNPEKNNHLEIFTEKSEVARYVHENINQLGIDAKITTRKGNMLVYLKDGDQIVTLLTYMGAYNAILQIENVRIVKGMRNEANRIVNFETANVDRTVLAAAKHLEAIEIIQKQAGLSKLPPKLGEMATLRMENPYATLKELGELADPPVSRSTVNYRLQQLIELSKGLDC